MIGRNDLLTTAEAAKRYGVAPFTLKKWRHVGTGPEYVKLGAAVRYSTAALDAFIAEHTRTGTERERVDAR